MVYKIINTEWNRYNYLAATRKQFRRSIYKRFWINQMLKNFTDYNRFNI